jgi:3',5'-cyclic AMP phosphodiesterase CpdA
MSFLSALVHLSDIECGENNRADSETRVDSYQKVAQLLVKDAKAVLAEAKVDSKQVGLIVTGDIANKGDVDEGVDEYGKAAKTIECLRKGLGIKSSRRIAMVPGNHDVGWKHCEQAFRLATSAPAGAISNRTAARNLPEKLGKFNTFCRAVWGTEYGPPEAVKSFSSFADLGIALVGFDSTFFCTFVDEDNHGILRNAPIKNVGRQKLKSLLDKDPKLIPVAMFHHCPNPLTDHNPGDTSYMRNATEAMEWLHESGFSVVLCGHEHHARCTSDLRNDCHILVTGTYGLGVKGLTNSYGGSSRIVSNKYQIILVQPDGISEVCLRELKEPGIQDSEWQEDRTGGKSRVPLHFHRPKVDKAEIGVSPHLSVSLVAGDLVHFRERSGAVVAVKIVAPKGAISGISAVTYQWQGHVVTKRNDSDNFCAELEIDPSGDRKIVANIDKTDGSPLVRTTEV